MTVPLLHVYLALGDDPLDTSPTWVEVTDLLAPVPARIRRGRNDEWSPVQPGQAWLIFEGYGRLLDPTYASGAYYGQLKPRTQVLITGEVASVEYERFRGWVKSFPQEIDGATPWAATVEVECYDQLGWCSIDQVPSDLYEATVEAFGTPLLWLRDIEAGRWIDTAAAGYSPTVSAGSLTSATSLADGLGTVAAVASGSTWATTANGLLIVDSDPWTFTTWIKTTAVSVPIARRYCNVIIAVNTRMSIDADGHFYIKMSSTPIGPEKYTEITSSMAINDGLPHFVAITCDGSSNPTLYIDGVADEDATVGEGSTPYRCFGVQRIWANGNTFAEGGEFPTAPTLFFTGSMQEFYVADFEWSAAQVESAYGVGVAWLEESSADRTTRLLDLVDFPSAWRDISTATRAEVGKLAGTGQSLLAALREVERSEQGRLFASKDGKLALLARYHHQEVSRGSTVQATFSDDGSDFGYEAWSYVEQDTDVANDITVSTPTGQRRSRDSTSRTSYGNQPRQVATILASLERAQEMADGLVYWWKNALGRFAPFPVDTVGLTDGEWQTLLGLELGDRIQVEGTPLNVGSQHVTQLLVDSMTEEIMPGGAAWRVVVGGSPVPPAFFVIGTSVLGTGVLGF